MEPLVLSESSVARKVKDADLVLHILQFVQPLISSRLEACVEVLFVKGLSCDLVDVVVKCVGVLDEHGNSVEALVEVSKKVVFVEVDFPKRPPVLGLLFEIDAWGFSPRHVDGVCRGDDDGDGDNDSIESWSRVMEPGELAA